MASLPFGKYRLIAELGHGGMADVFLAIQAGPAGSGFRKLTVLKRLRQNLVEEPAFVAMLVDEARIAARLNHPNVVQTNEVGNVGEQYFIAMEYLDGQPLHRIQHRCGQRVKAGQAPLIEPPHVLLILMDALAGLHHAHELADYDGTPLQIVHRDMTPHNVFVTYDGQVKVVDFGVAKAVGRSSETQQGIVKGKIRYMAPEQASGHAITRRCDIFSVGVMLWEAIVGRRMWVGMDDVQIANALVAGNLPPMPAELDPRVSPALDQICRKALAVNPDERYGTAEELRSELERYLVETNVIISARRALGPAVIELFKDKRADIKAVIEQQLAVADETLEGPMSLASVMAESSGSHSMTSSPRSVPTDGGATLSFRGPAIPIHMGPEEKAPRWRKPVLVAVALVAALGTVAVWRKTAALRNVAPARVAAAEVVIRLTANVPSATVTLDDRPAAPLPLELKLAPDSLPHRVLVEADGFQSHTDTLSFATGITRSFELIPQAKSAPATTIASAAPVKTTASTPAPPAWGRPWRPPANAKPADTKPADSKPADSKPAATTTADGKPKRPAIDKDPDPWAK
jgi:serine/threonine-protein kinase